MLIALLLAQTCASPFVCDTGAQFVGGQKVHTDLLQAYGAYDYGGRNASFISINDVLTGGALSSIYENGAVIIIGRRVDGEPGAGVIVINSHYLTSGGPFAVWAGGSNPRQQLVDDFRGNLILFPAPLEDGSAAPDILHRGMLVVGNTASGAIALQSAPKEYLALEYRLPEQCAKNPDGSEPAYDGGNTVTCYDGGCCYDYAGKHGGVSSRPSRPMKQGWLLSEQNPGVYGSDDKFIVHATGAFGMANGLNRSDFPTCPSPLAMTDLGQFYPGVPPGVIAYAADEDQFYVCRLCGWRTF